MARTVLVTGSAGGIGGATAALLRERGERVIGLDLHNADITADMATPEGRAAAVAQAIELADGELDAVIACAGLACPDTDAMIAVNYFGTVALIEGLRETLTQSVAPRVVAVSSSASILPTDPELVAACLSGNEAEASRLGQAAPDRVYASTKRALSRWLRAAAPTREWAGCGILLNGIAPGTVRTAMTAQLLESAEGRAMLALATPIAAAEFAEPQDIAPLLAFLSSAECRYMVGQVLFIDGGSDALLRSGDIWD